VVFYSKSCGWMVFGRALVRNFLRLIIPVIARLYNEKMYAVNEIFLSAREITAAIKN